MTTNTLFTPEEYKKTFRKNKNTKKEENVQMAVCNYLKQKYPKVIFTCDLASGMKLPIHIAAKNKAMRSSRGLPDLFIAHPSKGYSGLFIEIKRDGVKIYKENGELMADKHVREQHAILQELADKGYRTSFGVGKEACIKIIDEYLE